MRDNTIDGQIATVLRNDLCSGCGACCLLDPGLEMQIVDGYERPVRTAGTSAGPDVARTFGEICPGLSVTSPAGGGRRHHPLVGDYLAMWSAHAADPRTRFVGSSGGVLTALSGWLLDEGEVAQIVGAAAGADARRTVPVRITSKEEALASAGSRYGPVANASCGGALDGAGGFVGKPCEVSAVRALSGRSPGPQPLLLSFFCAGTPSPDATDDLVDALGVDAGQVTSLRYRGHGWPGRFTVETGSVIETMSYDESWGSHLGRKLQWRCKICPDGLGGAADIVAGDYWEVDERGYPCFEDGAGRSVVIARTPRGLDVLERAIAAGVLVAEPVEAAAVASGQPSQQKRRETLVGRLTGSMAAGRRIPRFRGFGLLRRAPSKLRDNLVAARHSRRRILAEQAARAGGRP